MSVVPPLSGPPLYRYIPGVGKVGTTQEGPRGPTGPQGIPGTAVATGATGPTGTTGPAGFQSFTAATGAVLFYGNGVTGRADFSLTDSTFQIPGDMIPSANNTYSLGRTGARWKEVLVGPGSINISGPPGFTGSATIGTDSAGLIYTESGFASPKIVIGPAQLTPQALGGWQIGPTGTQGTSDYKLVVQELQANGSGPTGPLFVLAPTSVALTGPTGSTGPPSTVTGPTGPAGGTSLLPSSFVTSPTATVLATGPTGTSLTSSTITTTQTGYIWSTSSVEIKNNDATSVHDVVIYQIVNGYRSDGMSITIPRKTNNGTFQIVTLSYRSDTRVPPGTYPIEVYGYTDAVTTNVTAIHRDTFAIGHLG